MGRLDLPISSLRSRRTRSRIVGPNQTMRRIGDIVEPNQPSDGGFLENAGNFLRPVGSFVGWLLGGVGGILSFSFTALWSIIVNTTGYIFNFNWNITDKEIDSQFQSLKRRIVGQLGGSVGNLLGYTSCGVVPAVGIISLNEILGNQGLSHQSAKGRGPIPCEKKVGIDHYEVKTDPYYQPQTKGIEGNFYHILPNSVNIEGISRGEFGIHFDANAPGSAGCIVIRSQQEWKGFQQLMKHYKEAGLETVPLSIVYT